MKENPFTILFGVEPDSMIPRNNEFQKVVQDFKSPKPMSKGYVITGVRGCGKTVLMTSIQNHFAKQPNWEVLRLNPELDLYESAISQLGEVISLKEETISEINISVAGFGGGFSKKTFSTNETILKKMLLVAKEKKISVLITIDEASNTENLRAFSHSFQAFIGEKLPVFLLMTALPENFSALANSTNGTFMRRLPRIKLDALNPLLIENKYKQIFSINDEEALQLSKTIKGYSYAFQLLGMLLWESNKKQADEEILIEMDALLSEGAYRPIWEHLTEKEREVVCAIAHSKEHRVSEIRKILNMESNQFSPYRENLKECGLIDTSTYGRIYFSLPRFEKFVLQIERYMA
ncbi:DEAD/DEAH box helicase family protein [Eubacterium oxidoreducens]|uniref:Helicase/UvrB N-terminal domain-containing protein n=1 Tax=Eubacterium oxidoreducens TaxID=1732 RepID=A0A1G6CNC5_EUBOX|nr:DEAD/DEAH box helicase family protein [Eubacterium oxidoreducens]SDB34389.1 hypothetical protein SAMN02910417_02538 [Eubacterium oxidoreducens]